MSSTQVNFEKASHLFFEDGDIVISAQRPGSDTTCLFKLHRRVLATHAKGLADILLLPAAEQNGANVNEHYEGMPIVHLFDDPADLAKFFKAMYNPSTLIFRRSMANNAADAYPLLVLADKYVADDIECMIEFQIRQDWPKTIHEWDAFESRAVHMFRMHQQTKGARVGPWAWDALVPEPASYIRLARIAKVAERTRVAAAFYQLSRMKAVCDQKIEFQDPPMDPTPTQLAKIQSVMWSILTEEELHRVEKGKEMMTSHATWLVQTLPKQIDLCVVCSQAWKVVAATLMSSDDILADLLRFCRVETSPLRPYMCVDCLTTVFRVLSGERARIWSLLPDYFEVCPNERACLDTYCTDSEDSEFVLM